MIYHQYDADGFLLGWYEADSPHRPNSTAVAPPDGSGTNRWTGSEWVTDTSRQDAAVAETNRRTAIEVVQRRLDTLAQAWGYDSIFSACTYADEPSVPQFQAEGQALRAWRSQTWAACWVNANAASLEALMAALPPAPARPAV